MRSRSARCYEYKRKNGVRQLTGRNDRPSGAGQRSQASGPRPGEELPKRASHERPVARSADPAGLEIGEIVFDLRPKALCGADSGGGIKQGQRTLERRDGLIAIARAVLGPAERVEKRR